MDRVGKIELPLRLIGLYFEVRDDARSSCLQRRAVLAVLILTQNGKQGVVIIKNDLNLLFVLNDWQGQCAPWLLVIAES